MKTLKLVARVVLLPLAMFVVSSQAFAQAEVPPPALTLRTASLNFTTAQMVNSQTVRAFVRTGSQSVKCLVTVNETNNVQTGTVFACGEREPVAFGGVPGMLVTVNFPQPVTSDFVMAVTLYQQGAETYGAPVLCTIADGCD